MATIASANEQPVPPAKKQRRELDLGGPMEDEFTARNKLEEAGFDPDNIEAPVSRRRYEEWGNISSMSYFCFKGDLPMCRYLLSQGASTTKGSGSVPWDFPMMMAARGGRLEVCKFLYDHGAENSIRRAAKGSDGRMLDPLFYTCRSSDENHINVGKWLIIKGAISAADDGHGTVDRKLMRSALGPLRDSKDYIFDESPAAQDIRPVYLSWAQGISSAHDSFFVFLCGATLATTPPSFSKLALLQKLTAKLDNSKVASSIVESLADKSQRQVWQDFFDLPIRGLSGKSGLLRLIADFAGVVRGKELKIIRGLEHELRSFIAAEPFDDDESNISDLEASSFDSYDGSDSGSE